MSAQLSDPGAATRRKRLLIASVATLAATLWAALQSDDAAREVAPAAPRGTRPIERPANKPHVSADSIAWPAPPDPGRRQAWRPAAPQGLAAWSGPAPPPAPTAQAPAVDHAAAPQPPPFPYTLIGRLDDGEPRALLSGPLRSFGVKAKEVIDGQWRVDAVLPTGVSLTWLPGGIKRNLPFAAS